jgi:hypothetical protein
MDETFTDAIPHNDLDPLRRIPPGSPVEVRNHLNNRWVGGFDIESVTAFGYEVRRHSDGRLLPAVLPKDDVRFA